MKYDKHFIYLKFWQIKEYKIDIVFYLHIHIGKYILADAIKGLKFFFYYILFHKREDFRE